MIGAKGSFYEREVSQKEIYLSVALGLYKNYLYKEESQKKKFSSVALGF